MFTGIIQAVGCVRDLTPRDGDVRLTIETETDFFAGVKLGDSIAVSGACLTAVDLGDRHFAADVSRETLDLTTLGRLASGHRVNLEKALGAGEPLGGHFVTGHVDGIGKLVDRRPDARSIRMRFEVPASLEALVADKGSIAIEGVSLTVNRVQGRIVEINLVPHTLEWTNLDALAAGDPVNMEADLLARYLARMISVSGYNGGIDRDFLKEHGYAPDDA
ncbi:MAG: riboflavin synthase [Pseudomonadota bacterium]